MFKKNDLSLADGNLKHHLLDMLSSWKSMWQEGCINLRRTKQEEKCFHPFYGFFIAMVWF